MAIGGLAAASQPTSAPTPTSPAQPVQWYLRPSFTVLAPWIDVQAPVLFVDIDRFKTVNDAYGHRAGDCVLREAAARLKACTREVDTVARYGGDEFIVVLEGLGDVTDAETVARRIVTSLARGFSYESMQIELSASVGIATSSRTGRDGAELIEAADRAMYSAKRSGGGTTAVA